MLSNVSILAPSTSTSQDLKDKRKIRDAYTKKCTIVVVLILQQVKVVTNAILVLDNTTFNVQTLKIFDLDLLICNNCKKKNCNYRDCQQIEKLK